jgi:hypothetical protein
VHFKSVKQHLSIIPSEEIGPHEIDSDDEDLFGQQQIYGMEGTLPKLLLNEMQIESSGYRSEATGVSNAI